MVGSALVHGAAAALAFGAASVREVSPPVYAVELVAAPLPTSQRRLAPEAVSRPREADPVPAPPKAAETPAEKGAPPKTVEKAKPAPASPATATPPDASREKAPDTRSKNEPLPGETPATGTDVANIKIPGIAFPYPDYLRNIMNEVLRRWNAPSDRRRAEVEFMILKDGTVTGIRFVKRSGNFSFDLEAQGAIESAGNAKAFGPLPDGWDANVLPVTFVFEPRQ
jgi:protein TonB